MKFSPSLLLLFACVPLLSPLHAETYNNWEFFLTKGLAGLSNGTTTPIECTFEATANVRQGASWTGNNGTTNNPIPGTVVIDGKGYSLSGAGYMFGGNYPKYSGELTVTNWQSFGGFTQTGSNNAPLFQLSSGSITVSNSTVENNIFNLSQKVTGGVIYSYSGTSTTITDSTFANNTLSASSSNGKGNGLVLNNAGYAHISNSAFTNNQYLSTKSDTWGAAIFNTGTTTLEHVTFSGNVAAKGGAIYNSAGTLNITGGSFVGNTALIYSSSSYGGGAIFNNSKTSLINIDGTIFSDNQGYAGGAIYENTTGNYTISNAGFTNNTATSGNGGAIRAAKGSMWQVEGSVFDGNAASSKSSYGGAMWLTGATAAFIDTDFINNSVGRSNSGGALYLAGSSTVTIVAENDDVLLSGNQAGTWEGYTLSSNAIAIGSASAAVYLNAEEGKSVTFKGDSIVGTSTSSNYYTKNDVYINSAEADADVMSSGVQSAGTAGTVRFTEGSVLENINMQAEGGLLEVKDSTLYSSSVTLSGDASANFERVTLGCRDSSEFDYYSKPKQLYTEFTLEEATQATLKDCSILLTSQEEAVIIMSAGASLTLEGTLTIELSSIYSSKEELVIDENFSLQLVNIVEEAATASTFSLAETQQENAAGLHTEGLTIALAYEGEEIAHTGILNEAALTGSGSITFTSTDNVPEPTAITLSLLALTGLAARRRRK